MQKEILMESEETIAARERKQFEKMTKTPIAKLVISLGIPTMLSMMVTSLYNLADTYFVSLIGEDSITAAVSNLLALMSIIQAIGFTYGMGSGSIVSKLLGKRDREGADKVASSAFAIGAVSGLVILVIGFIFLKPMLWLFGSRSEAVLGYSIEYAIFILLAAPFMCMSFVMNNVLRAEGKAVLSMIGLIVGAVVNVILDPIFIFALDMGIMGAALATCLSQFTSFAVLLSMFIFHRSIVRIRFASISKQFSVYRDIIETGFPSFCRRILASLCSVFLNGAAFEYGRDAAQASLGVVQKVFMFAFSISLGIGQGYQPVLGYNYSSKNFERVRSAYLFTLLFSTSLMTFFGVVCGIFAAPIMQMFSLSEEATKIGELTLRLQCFTMPLLPTNFMVGLTYQVVGDKRIATLLSASRQGLFYIPSVLILPRIFKILGVQSCQAVSDFFSFFFAIPFTMMFFKTLKAEQAKHENMQEKVAEDEKFVFDEMSLE
jgi:putative MATE family efflux protein